MSGALSFAEIDGQHVELLPARTVLSLFIRGGGVSCAAESKNNVTVGVQALNDVLGIASPGDRGSSVSPSATNSCGN